VSLSDVDICVRQLSFNFVPFSSGAKMILKQIEVNRQEKLLKDEMREQENMMMVGHLEKLQKEDYEELKKRKEKQKLLAVRHFLIGL